MTATPRQAHDAMDVHEQQRRGRPEASLEACVVADRFPAVNVLDPGGVGGHGLGADTVDEPVVPWLRPPVP